ncbi:MAG: isochorismatase family protein [Ilumatobacter sp.]|nr:isochorismatase family protein [Ilumatobacter sp.]
MAETPAPTAATDYDTRTALVVVDVQNDFADPDGSLFVRGGDAVVDLVNDEIERARAAGAFVVYTQDWHPPETPHFVTDGGTWPVHCVRDTWGAELHPSLTVDGPVVRKGTGGEDGYSGFSMQDPDSGEVSPTGLDDLLRERDIERVVAVGLALDVCVKATALDAIDLGYDTSVVVDATAPVDLEPGDGERAVEAMQTAGATIR